MTLRSDMDLAETIALEMDDGLIPHEDLVSEAYLGLAEALNELGEEADEDQLDDRIRAHLRAVIEENRIQAQSDEYLIGQVRELSESIEKLTKELGTRPNLDELANDMGVTQDEVLAVLKLAGEDVDKEMS